MSVMVELLIETNDGSCVPYKRVVNVNDLEEVRGELTNDVSVRHVKVVQHQVLMESKFAVNDQNAVDSYLDSIISFNNVANQFVGPEGYSEQTIDAIQEHFEKFPQFGMEMSDSYENL